MTPRSEEGGNSGAACCATESQQRNDLVGSRMAWLAWRLPNLLVLLGIFWSEGRVWLWLPAFLVAGVACLANAARCGRRHCYFTGPVYLLGAAATLLTGLGALSLHWSWILIGVVAGGILGYVPEWMFGKYVNKPHNE